MPQRKEDDFAPRKVIGDATLDDSIVIQALSLDKAAPGLQGLVWSDGDGGEQQTPDKGITFLPSHWTRRRSAWFRPTKQGERARLVCQSLDGDVGEVLTADTLDGLTPTGVCSTCPLSDRPACERRMIVHGIAVVDGGEDRKGAVRLSVDAWRGQHGDEVTIRDAIVATYDEDSYITRWFDLDTTERSSDDLSWRVVTFNQGVIADRDWFRSLAAHYPDVYPEFDGDAVGVPEEATF